jgi:hypothetical protein
MSSLTMSYFHTGIRTIIGAESFHCPVRDGKEWDQLAMVIRLKPLPPRETPARLKGSATASTPAQLAAWRPEALRLLRYEFVESYSKSAR